MRRGRRARWIRTAASLLRQAISLPRKRRPPTSESVRNPMGDVLLPLSGLAAKGKRDGDLFKRPLEP